MKIIYLAGGCFWGIEAYFKLFDFTLDSEVGYANGNYLNPKYEELKSHKATHAETLKLTYKDETSLETIISTYLEVVNPYAINKQGEDEGLQYRTGIYTTSKDELEEIKKIIEAKEKEFNKGKFQIELSLLDNYSPAEEYHQDYLDKHKDGYCHINLSKYKK
jgi:methionine-S-sulfoxide reductase